MHLTLRTATVWGRSKYMKTIKSFLAAFSLLMVFAVVGMSQTMLTGLDGGRVDVQGQRGKVVVLAIGASWLPLSGKQVEYTNAIASKYRGRDVVVYFVATDSTSARSRNFASDDAIKSFAATNKLTVPVLRDSEGTATKKTFGYDQMPSFIVIDRSGVAAGPAFGGIDTDPRAADPTIRITKAIDKLLG